MPRLSEEDLRARKGIPEGWEVTPAGIRKTYTFADFRKAVAFVNAVADAAEAMQHHPDIDIRYNKVTLTSTSHDAGGITERDLKLAAQIDPIATDAGHGG